MSNFKTIIHALKAAKAGATNRVAMGMSLGDDAYGDCVLSQCDDLLYCLGLDENAIGWNNHVTVYHRFRRAFNRVVY